MGMIQRKVRPHHIFKLTKDTHQNAAILQGMQQHLATDAWWHSSEYFAKKQDSIKKVLHTYHLAQKPFRPFFMTHVMCELLIDRQLVIHHPFWVEDFYTSLEKIPPHMVDSIFVHFGLQHKMNTFLSRFCRDRFLIKYGENEGFQYALNRLFSRVGHPPIALTGNSFSALLQELDNTLKDYDVLFSDA